MAISSDFQQRRTQRRLEELERTNPTDVPPQSFVPPPPGAPGSAAAQAHAAQVVATKKKQTPNVRRALGTKKTLRDWLGELPSNPTPPYVTAAAPPTTTPAAHLCASCGYIGAYKCQRCGDWNCSLECVGIHERDGGCGVGG